MGIPDHPALTDHMRAMDDAQNFELAQERMLEDLVTKSVEDLYGVLIRAGNRSKAIPGQEEISGMLSTLDDILAAAARYAVDELICTQ